MTTQGERVKKIRQELGLSQDKFGGILGIGKQFVSKIENNTALLNNEKLVTLLVNYNVNANYILSGKGSMFIKERPPGLKEEIKAAVREMLKDEGLTKDDIQKLI